MKIPYSENPTNWQTAYTLDQAKRDSSQYRNEFVAVVLFEIIFCLTYIFLRLSKSSAVFDSHPTLILVLSFLFLIISLTVPFRFALRFLIDFYHPSDRIELAKVINYRIFSNPNIFSPFTYLIARDGLIVYEDRWQAWSAIHLGGPIQLVVFDGCALYLEREARFSRVVGPGENAILERYETIKYVVDLRPQIRTSSFACWTKDGIKLMLSFQFECRIGDPKNYDPSASLVYPFDPIAVKKAVELYSVWWFDRQHGELSEFTWLNAAWGQVESVVRNYIGSRTIDDLFVADQNGEHILSKKVNDKILRELNMATNGFGVFITDFQILKFDMSFKVSDLLNKNQRTAQRKKGQ